MDDQIVVKPQKRHWGVAIAAIVIVAVVTATNYQANSDSYQVPVTTALMFAPTLIAALRRHRNATAIFVCNLIVFGIVLSASLMPQRVDIEFMFALAVATIGTTITMVWAFVTNRID